MSRYLNDLGLEFSCSPGYHLVGYLEDKKMSRQELSRKTDVSAKYISDLISEKTQMTADVAIQFEKLLGVAADFWMGFEMRYQLKKAYDAENEAKRTKSKRIISISNDSAQNEAVVGIS